MKKLALYFVSFCSFFFVGCSDNSPTPDSKDPTEFTVTYKSDANTEVGIQNIPIATPTLTRDSTNSFLVEGKYTSKFFSDEAKMTAFTFLKELTAGITIYVTFKDVVTPADSTALRTEVDKAIAADGNSPDLNYINTEKVTNMNRLFLGFVDGAPTNKQDFNGDISLWDVGAVTNMTQMFQSASNFNGDISKWKVSAVTQMAAMFLEASAFNQDISSWDVSAVENIAGMFEGASAFNQDISSWEVSALVNTGAMFKNATAFDQDLEAWGDHLTLDDNGKFTGSGFLFNKTDMFKGSPLEDNPPGWY